MFAMRLGLAALVGFGLLSAHDLVTTKLTWSREVSRVFYRRCVSCHRSGGVAFPLTVYTEVRPWARAISEQVLSRQMPPWNAVKGFGDFRNDHGLSQEEITVIGEWVEGGAPEGDGADMPALPPIAPNGKPVGGRRELVSGSRIFARAAELIGIQPGRAAEMRVVLREVDGTLLPLLWHKQFGKTFQPEVYEMKTPQLLRAGSRIEIWPENADATLILRSPPVKAKRQVR